MTSPETAAAADGDSGTDIITAARLLGVQVETLRKRLQRGSVKGYKAADGTWRVILDQDLQDRARATRDIEQATIEVLLAEVAALRQETASLAEETRATAALLSETHESLAAMQRLIESLQRPNGDDARDDQLRPVMMAVLDYLRKSKPS